MCTLVLSLLGPTAVGTVSNPIPAPKRNPGSERKGLVSALGRDKGPDEPETSHCAPENINAQGNVDRSGHRCHLGEAPAGQARDNLRGNDDSDCVVH